MIQRCFVLLAACVAIACASDFALAPPRLGPPNQRPVNVSVQFQPYDCFCSFFFPVGRICFLRWCGDTGVERRLKLLEVDSATGKVRIQAYFDQFWRDSRLVLNASDPADSARYDKVGKNGRRYYLAASMPWVPDLAFPTAALRTNLAPYGDSDPHFASTFTRVFENGDVHLSLLVDLTVPVKFAIAFFPFEVVTVPIGIESYGNSEADIRLVLTPETLVRVNRTEAIPGYEIVPELAFVKLTQSLLPEGNYSSIEIVMVLKGAASDILINGVTTTTVLVLLAGSALWYDTDFNNKLAIVATALLTSFALAFSFELPASRQSLLIELFFLSHQVFLGAVAGAVFMSYMLKSVRKSLLPNGMNFVRQDDAMKVAVKQLRVKNDSDDEEDPALEHAPRSAKRKAKKGDKKAAASESSDDERTLKRVQSATTNQLDKHSAHLTDAQKQVALLSLIELGLRDEKNSEHSPVRPWQLFSVIAYTLLWLVNVAAFVHAGQYVQAQALLPERRDAAQEELQREAGIQFLIVYLVAGSLAVVLALITSFIWRHRHKSIIFCCARIMVSSFSFDDDEDEHAAELRTLAEIKAHKQPAPGDAAKPAAAVAAAAKPTAAAAAAAAKHRNDDNDDDNAPPPAYDGGEFTSARKSAAV